MRIEVKGRNVPVSDDLREHVDQALPEGSRQVSELAELEVELFEERNPAIADSQVAEATLHLKGVTLRARDASRDSSHSINLCADELAVQVKRHRDKRRKRREARAVRRVDARAGGADGPPSGDVSPAAYAGRRRAAARSARARAGPAPRRYASRMSFLDRALRMGEAKKFKSYEQRVARINAFEPE